MWKWRRTGRRSNDRLDRGGSGLGSAHGRHHLLTHCQAGAKLRRRAGRTAAFALGHRFSHLELHVIVQIADRRHARSLVDGPFHFGGHGDVLDDEAADLDAVFRGGLRIDQGQERVTQFGVARRHVQYRHLR